MSSSNSVNTYIQEKRHSSFQKGLFYSKTDFVNISLEIHISSGSLIQFIKFTQVRAEINAFAFSSKCQTGDDRLYSQSELFVSAIL